MCLLHLLFFCLLVESFIYVCSQVFTVGRVESFVVIVGSNLSVADAAWEVTATLCCPRLVLCIHLVAFHCKQVQGINSIFCRLCQKENRGLAAEQMSSY